MARKLVLLFVITFLFRLSLAPIARHGDINNNTSWGQLLLARGSSGFYEGKNWPNSAPNQPPLYLILFGATAFVQNTGFNFIHWANDHISLFPSKIVWWYDNWGELYIAKFPGILVDLGIAVVIYKFVSKKKLALVLAAVWLVNPVSWYGSGIWGSTDSIVNLLGLLSIYYLLKKENLVLSVLYLVLSILFKGSLVLFVPLLLFIALKQKHSMQSWAKGLGAALLVVTVTSLPFHFNLDLPVWLFRLYTEKFFPGEIGSLTANAFNFWWIVDSGKTLDSTIYLGFTARMWGIFLMILGYVFVVWRNFRNQSLKSTILSLALISLISFLFMTRIHERYMYPFFPLATIALAYFSWLWVPYVILSLTMLLNLYHLFWAPGLSVVQAWYLNPMFMVVLSVVNIGVFGYLFCRFTFYPKKSV